MNKTRGLSLAGALIVSLAYSTSAMAVTSTRVMITEDQEEVPETRIQLFDAETGIEVPREEDDDDSGALFLLDGGAYRVVVDGETVREISVTGTGSETFRIGLTPSAPYDDGFMPGGGIALGFDHGEVAIPGTGIGFRRDGAYGEAPDEAAGQTPERIDSTGIYGSGFFYIPGTDSVVRIGGGYREGDGGAGFEIPRESGIDSGVVYGGLSPSGSSGIATPFGLSGETRIDYSSWNLAGSYRIAGSEMTGFELDGYAQYRRFDREYSSMAYYTGVAGAYQYAFAQMREQSLREDTFELGLSGTASFMPMRPVRPYVRLGGGIYHRSTELHSLETNTSNFGPAEDREFTLMFHESQSDFGFHGAAEAGVEFDVARAFAIAFGASADYWSEAGAVFNPHSGDQVFYDGLTTGLREEDNWAWRGFVEARLRF